MDKKEIFYEGLDLVTGLVFHKDGVIVTQAPDILWLRDTNGDGKADKVEKLYTGLGIGDTHAVINNPRWGWDGWIYATHGYSGSNNVRNAKGETHAEHRQRRRALQAGRLGDRAVFIEGRQHLGPHRSPATIA